MGQWREQTIRARCVEQRAAAAGLDGDVQRAASEDGGAAGVTTTVTPAATVGS